ncbi:hypothetical protein [Rhizobium wenxiniae]|uniref:hypothetical protein n=1 Tax=Rhizobium wenxiniae TaxID=1737357 RepID=UPI003C25FAB9
MSLIVLALRKLGLLGTVIVLGYLFYEGAPGLRDIPYIDRIPMARELLAGRVRTEVAKERERSDEKIAAAREGYVLETELLTAQAQVKEMARQRDANALAFDDYRKHAFAAAEIERLAEEQTEKAIAEDTNPNGSDWTDDDRLWLCAQRRAPDCSR